MPDLPPALRDYLQALTAQARHPAWLRVGRDGNVLDVGGAIAEYGLGAARRGERLSGVEFLEGLLPLDDQTLMLPCVSTGTTALASLSQPNLRTDETSPDILGCADVHLVPDEGADWVLLLDATAEARRQRQVQQKANELALLRERQDKLLAKMNQDLSIAARVQRALLPATLPAAGPFSFAFAYRPCDELGGDLLNVFAIDERRIGLYLLDVSGHGVAAALLAVSVSRALAPAADRAAVLASPAAVARELNRRFPFDALTTQYFTILYGVLDFVAAEFRYVAAGHPTPLRVNAAGVDCPPGTGGPPVGIVDGYEFDEQLVRIAPGDRLYLYSDGVTEAMSPAMEPFGEDRFADVLGRTRDRPLAAGVAAVADAAAAWSDDRLKDDVSVLALAREGGDNAAAMAKPETKL